MNAKGTHILLIEDDPALGALTQEYLSEFGFETCFRQSARQRSS